MARSLVRALALLAVAPLAQAQTTAPGFVSTTLTSPGSKDNCSVTLSNGSYLVLSPTDLTLHAPGGPVIRTLHTYGSGVSAWPSFVLVDPSETFVVYGLEENEYSYVYFEGIFRVDLVGGTPAEIKRFNAYQGAFETPNTTLGPWHASMMEDCGVARLDLSTGLPSSVVEDQGWAGPLVVDTNGDLLLVTTGVAPQPPNGWDIRRFSASQIAGAPALPFSAGAVEHSGLWEIRGLARDPFGGELFVAVAYWKRQQVRTLGDPRLPELLVEVPWQSEYFDDWDHLQFLPGDGRAAFLPYQPASGGTLIYTSMDTLDEHLYRRALTPARPVASVNGPGTSGPGRFEVALHGGPPGGLGIVAYGPSSTFDPDELVLNLRVPVFIGLALTTMQVAPGRIQLDANGAGAISYENPNGVLGQFALQVLLLDGAGKIVGTSSAAFL